MDQTPQNHQPVMGIASGAPQIAYPVPAYPSTSIAGPGGGAIVGAVTSSTQPAASFAASPSQLAAQHQLYQHLHHQQLQQQQQQLKEFWANQAQEIEHTTDFKNHSLPLARIKKIMKADEDVRMISAEAPVIFAKACEILILELTLRSWIHTEENKRRTLQKNDIAAAITRTDIFDFLVDIVPRDELKEEGLGFPRAAQPVVGMHADAVPYYYVAPQHIAQVGTAGMMVGKPVDQAALYQPPHNVGYMPWQQQQSIPQAPQPHHQYQQPEDDA